MVVMAIFNIQSVFRTGAAGVGWCPHLYKPVSPGDPGPAAVFGCAGEESAEL